MKMILTLLLLFGMSPETINLSAFVIGLLAYFTGEFKSRSVNNIPFNWAYWIKDNKFNVMFYVLGVAAYFITNVELSPFLCLAAGYVPNTIMDQWQTISQKKS